MTNTIKSNNLICYHLNQCNEQLEKQLQSQIITIRSPIYRGLDDVVRTEIESIVEKTQSKNKMLPKLTVILETTGGSIEVVERISNVFRKHFHEVDYIVPGYAYSAGTVLVLSGDNIYMDYYSVLGPIDPQIEQAKNHSEDLIKEWLPKYKFKHWKFTETRNKKVTLKMKQERAADIAKILGNAAKWHSHGKGITMRELTDENIKLKIDDFGSKNDLNKIIRQYYDLFIDYGNKIGAQYAIHTKYGLRRI